MKPSADPPPPSESAEDASLALLEVQMIEAHHNWWKVFTQSGWEADPDARQVLNSRRVAYQDAVLMMCQSLQMEPRASRPGHPVAGRTAKHGEAVSEAVRDSLMLTTQVQWLMEQAGNPHHKCAKRTTIPEQRVSCAARMTPENDLLVTVIGEIDFENAQVFRYLIQDQLDNVASTGPITVDLSLVSSIDPDGIDVLLSIYQSLIRTGRGMKLMFHSPDRARSLVQLALLSRLFPQGE